MENKKTKTTIQISVDLWKYLSDHKVQPGDTPEDIIWRFIRDDEPK